MTFAGLVTSAVRWVRAGHPEGLPTRAYVPLLALIPVHPSDLEIESGPGQSSASPSSGYQPAQG